MTKTKEIEDLKEAFGNLLASIIDPEKKESLSNNAKIIEKICENQNEIMRWCFGSDYTNEHEDKGVDSETLKADFKKNHPDLEPPTILNVKGPIPNQVYAMCLLLEITKLYYTARG